MSLSDRSSDSRHRGGAVGEEEEEEEEGEEEEEEEEEKVDDETEDSNAESAGAATGAGGRRARRASQLPMQTLWFLPMFASRRSTDTQRSGGSTHSSPPAHHIVLWPAFRRKSRTSQ